MKKETIILVLVLTVIAVGVVWVMRMLKETNKAIAVSKT
jgi:hypothetical protein